MSDAKLSLPGVRVVAGDAGKNSAHSQSANPAAKASSAPVPADVDSSTLRDQRVSGFELFLVLIAAGAAIIIALMVALAEEPLGPGEMTRERFFRSSRWLFCQTLLFGLFVIAAAWQAVDAKSGPGLLGLSFLILAFLVALAPLVEKISFPGSGSVDLGGEVKADVEALQEYAVRVQLALATSGSYVTQTLADLINTLPPTGDERRPQIVGKGLEVATELICAFLRPPEPASLDAKNMAKKKSTGKKLPVEPIRVTAWIRAGQGQFLSYVAGWPAGKIEALTGAFISVDDGSAASVAFRTHEVLNYAFVHESMRPTAAATQAYKGLLVLPLSAGGQCIGVLQIDRERAERLEPTSIAVGKQLAALYAGALTL